MQITDDSFRVPIDQIVVNRERRQRRQIDTKGLEESIKRIGMLHPIIVDRGMVLKTGERRLTSCKNLGHKDILVRYVDNLTAAESEIIELEENLKRVDLEWQEIVRSCARIHALYVSLDAGWTLGETAEEISLTSGSVSMYLKVAAEIEDERVAKASTIREAYNLLGRRDQRAAGEALQELLDTTDDILPQEDTPLLTTATSLPKAPADPAPARLRYPPVEDSILLESFLQWAPRYTGKKFNFVHCDFPYGINLFAGPQSGRDHSSTYADDKDIYIALLECFCSNLDRFMAISAHLMFWYSDKHRDVTHRIFRELAPSVNFVPYPLIWTKSDNAGIASDATRTPRHGYETCLFANRGGRQIVKIVTDWYSAPTNKSLHVSTKPEPMLKHFMSMVVDENTRMLDPTCGSAASLRAAEELGAAHVLGMDIDEQCVGISRQALRNSRSMRQLSREV